MHPNLAYALTLIYYAKAFHLYGFVITVLI